MSKNDGPRYLVIRGKTTAIRLALPTLGTVSIGSAASNDVVIAEPGVAAEHLVLFLDDGVGFEALVEDTALLTSNSKGELAEKPVSSKKTHDFSPDNRLRAGPIEIGIAPVVPFTSGRRSWAASYLETRAAEAIAEGRGSATAAVRFKVTPKEALAGVLEARLRAGDLVGDLGDGDQALLLLEANEPEAQALVNGIALDVRAKGGTLEVGVVMAMEASAEQLYELAAERAQKSSSASPPARSHRSRHPAMERVQRLIEQVGPSESHVLIVGETGVGKDVVAEQIHHLSGRSSRPLLHMNGLDLGDDFLESPKSFFARAAGGSVLLDEVAGLSSRAQLALGDLVEDSTAAPAGVRFLATSNQDLAELVATGAFRKDLYFRLNRVTINIPPLREHISDVAPLAELFLETASPDGHAPKVSLAAKERLDSYAWPGNLRELKSVMERALLASGGDAINVEHLPPEVAGAEPIAPSEIEATAPGSSLQALSGESGKSLREEMLALEKRRILEALEKYPTQTEAAKALDIPLRTFLNRLDALGIPRARKKDPT